MLEGTTFDDVSVIRMTVRSKNYGVLLTNTEDWNQFRQMKVYRDFSDIAVTVYSLTVGGYFSHNHINPIYLEEVDILQNIFEDTQKNEAYINAISSFSEYWRKEQDADKKTKKALLKKVIKYADEYSRQCAKCSFESKQFVVKETEVKDIYSIMV